MAKRKFIASFLFLLLFIFFNNNLPYELSPSFGSSHNATQSYLITKAAKSLVASNLSLNNHTVKKYHVKVRYMGSYCGFHSSPFHIAFTAHSFAEQQIRANDCSFISSNGRFLFKLRGPPPGLGFCNLSKTPIAV
jgi:hypothetical protein